MKRWLIILTLLLGLNTEAAYLLTTGESLIWDDTNPGQAGYECRVYWHTGGDVQRTQTTSTNGITAATLMGTISSGWRVVSIYPVFTGGAYGTPVTVDIYFDNASGANAVPSLSQPLPQTVNKNTSTPITFTIDDDTDDADDLTLSVVSSNHSLLTDENCVFTGSGTARTLTVSLEADAVGETDVTIGLADLQSGTNSVSFHLTAVNYPFANRTGSGRATLFRGGRQ